MSHFVRESTEVDVMLLAEGTYPYIRGGVSSWIHQLMNGLENIRFGICFLGSVESDYGEIKYELPDNLVHLEVHYMFDKDDVKIKKAKDKKAVFEEIKNLHVWFKEKQGDIPKVMKDVGFYNKDITFEHFLFAKESWEYINEKYLENCPDIPFIDYFWTLRSIHRPIWKLAKIVETLPTCKLFHAPSTGYAGFIGALASHHTNKPFIITEHGIYTRERKIDMLTSTWIDFHKPSLLKQPEEFNYIKKMWVSFFERIGEFAYSKASNIYSLYPGAQKIQHTFGADESKTAVIPNGVDVDGLNATLKHRDENVPNVITLIGRVVSIKDIKTFIRAIRIVANDIEDVEAWIVGPLDEDKEYASECFNMVESFGLSENVKFLGFQNIKDILPKSGIMGLSSISEGMPLVILEGFAAGLPCVATDVGSCRDLIEGALDDEDIALGKAGLVTSIANPSELAAAYLTLLKDKAIWKSAQKSALDRVEKYYRQELFLERYEKIYLELMEQN